MLTPDTVFWCLAVLKRVREGSQHCRLNSRSHLVNKMRVRHFVNVNMNWAQFLVCRPGCGDQGLLFAIWGNFYCLAFFEGGRRDGGQQCHLKNRSHLLKDDLLACFVPWQVLVGELVGARLISHAGSLINLAKQPASTVQILGAEKALFRCVPRLQALGIQVYA